MTVVCDGKETSRDPPSYMASYFDWGKYAPLTHGSHNYGCHIMLIVCLRIVSAASYNIYGAPYEHGVR